MKQGSKKRAPTPEYVSQNQLSLEGFETPFSQKLNKTNRWVVLAEKIPWDEICNVYSRQVGVSHTGRPPISPRIVIGSLIIKHMCNLDDRETVAQISENMYMQYFLGYSSFRPDPSVDASLFVEFRTRMGLENMQWLDNGIWPLRKYRFFRSVGAFQQTLIYKYAFGKKHYSVVLLKHVQENSSTIIRRYQLSQEPFTASENWFDSIIIGTRRRKT